MRSPSDWPVAFSAHGPESQKAKWELGVCQARQQGDHVIRVAVRVRPSDETQPYKIAAGNHRRMCWVVCVGSRTCMCNADRRNVDYLAEEYSSHHASLFLQDSFIQNSPTLNPQTNKPGALLK